MWTRQNNVQIFGICCLLQSYRQTDNHDKAETLSSMSLSMDRVEMLLPPSRRSSVFSCFRQRQQQTSLFWIFVSFFGALFSIQLTPTASVAGSNNILKAKFLSRESVVTGKAVFKLWPNQTQRRLLIN